MRKQRAQRDDILPVVIDNTGKQRIIARFQEFEVARRDLAARQIIRPRAAQDHFFDAR